MFICKLLITFLKADTFYGDDHDHVSNVLQAETNGFPLNDTAAATLLHVSRLIPWNLLSAKIFYISATKL